VGSPPYSAWEDVLTGRNNFATSAALAEVCALLSAVLVVISFNISFIAVFITLYNDGRVLQSRKLLNRLLFKLGPR